MAGPRRKPPPPPPPWWKRSLESRSVQAAALLTIFSLFSFLFGTTRDLALQMWRHYTGSELAHKLAPEVQELRKVVVDQAPLLEATLDRIDQGEKRLTQAERTLDDIAELKKVEQERTGAVFEAQRAACLAGELSMDACNRYGHRHRDAK